LREQFALTHFETVAMSVFAAVTIFTSWHFTNRAIVAGAEVAQAQTQLLSKAPQTAKKATPSSGVSKGHWH
jgi:hypothetical protein